MRYTTIGGRELPVTENQLETSYIELLKSKLSPNEVEDYYNSLKHLINWLEEYKTYDFKKGQDVTYTFPINSSIVLKLLSFQFKKLDLQFELNYKLLTITLRLESNVIYNISE